MFEVNFEYSLYLHLRILHNPVIAVPPCRDYEVSQAWPQDEEVHFLLFEIQLPLMVQ